MHSNGVRTKFATGKCNCCNWVGHGTEFSNGKFICTYCDPSSSEAAAKMQKDYWLKGGYIKWKRPNHR